MRAYAREKSKESPKNRETGTEKTARTFASRRRARMIEYRFKRPLRDVSLMAYSLLRHVQKIPECLRLMCGHLVVAALLSAPALAGEETEDIQGRRSVRAAEGVLFPVVSTVVAEDGAAPRCDVPAAMGVPSGVKFPVPAPDWSGVPESRVLSFEDMAYRMNAGGRTNSVQTPFELLLGVRSLEVFVPSVSGRSIDLGGNDIYILETSAEGP